MKVLLITPPFVQWNTAFAATPQLCAYLKQQNIDCLQYDLSILLINKLFSKEGLLLVFDSIEPTNKIQESFLKKREIYESTINTVIQFLQTNDSTLANLICNDHFLIQGNRFKNKVDTEWAFGNMGLVDKAKYLSTLFIEDIGDFIRNTITPHFGYSRYAESLAIAAHSFEPIQKEIELPNNTIDCIMLDLLDEKIKKENPSIIGFTIPFPGNLFSALKCCKFIKKNYPTIKIIIGGGYVNTELRTLKEKSIFDYVDFICLDDGEIPLHRIIQFLSKKIPITELVRTFILNENKIELINGNDLSTISFKELPAPDFATLPLNKYISTLELTNPMHRLWSDGLWNKMTLAHGCYWHQCSFCDVQLDYIKRYDAPSATIIANKIQQIIDQTGNRGFHFTDEAASPKLLKDLAEELVRRQIKISWWTNIRFEKTFSNELCVLLAKSGCIAVSGGLEVASERILHLINKGVTIEQAAQACKHFTNAGIMVHAYLMYGFPTQTAQETIDSLEIVRQFFENGLIQSGFWHRFTLTQHSAIALEPEKFGIKIKMNPTTFASNDLQHEDKSGCNHDLYADGLKTSLFNYMNGLGYEMQVNKWFDFNCPKTKHRANHLDLIVSRVC